MKKSCTKNMTGASAFCAEASCSCSQSMNVVEIIADAIILASVSVCRLVSLLVEVLLLKVSPNSISMRKARA